MKLKLPYKIAGITALALCVEQSVWSDVLPGPTMPETVSHAIKQQQPRPVTGVPSAVIQKPQASPSPLGPEAEKIKFQLNGIIITGNHVYSDEQLRPLYADKLHKTITIAELFNIVQSITNFYRNNGYIISRAILPPQHVKGGIVKIQVIEGFIDQVHISGEPHGAGYQVKEYGYQIRACPPLKISRMEKYLLLANELPATQVKAVLSPSKTQTGAADLTLMTMNTPITGYASYDDYGTRYIGPQQMTANVGLNSAIFSGDTTQFTFTKTPKGGEMTYWDLNHDMPITNEGTHWQLGTTRAQTHPLFVLQPLQVDGLNNNYYTMVNYPMIRTREKNLTLRTGFNYLDSYVTTAPDSQKLYIDHLRNIDLGGTFNFADRFYGANLLSADFRKGLPIWGYTSNSNPATAETSRPGGHANYAKVTAQFSRLQAIKGPFSLYGILSGQWAFDSLLASEQFTFGGSQLGRGYDVAELIGDRGLAGSLELRLDWAVQRFYIQNLQFYIFYDAGCIWNILKEAGSPGRLSGTSTGIGVRFFATKYISGNFMWTQTLTKPVAAEELISRGRRPRTFFSIVASWS